MQNGSLEEVLIVQQHADYAQAATALRLHLSGGYAMYAAIASRACRIAKRRYQMCQTRERNVLHGVHVTAWADEQCCDQVEGHPGQQVQPEAPSAHETMPALGRSLQCCFQTGRKPLIGDPDSWSQSSTLTAGMA